MHCRISRFLFAAPPVPSNGNLLTHSCSLIISGHETSSPRRNPLVYNTRSSLSVTGRSVWGSRTWALPWPHRFAWDLLSRKMNVSKASGGGGIVTTSWGIWICLHSTDGIVALDDPNNFGGSTLNSIDGIITGEARRPAWGRDGLGGG